MIEVINLKTQKMTDFEKKYFAFTEAPEDEQRTNVRRIRLKVSDGRRYDFRKGADGGEETPPEETTEETPTDDENIGDDVATDDTMDDDLDDDMDDDGGDVEDTGDDAGGDDEIATDTDAQEGDVTGDDGGDGENTGTDDKGGNPDVADSVRKQNLYRKFTNLYTAIDHYIHKLSTLIGMEEDINKEINAVTNKLKEIEDKIYDYMIIKFIKAPYEQSDLFYYRSVVGVSGLFDILEKIVEFIHTDDRKKEKSKEKSSTKNKT